MKVLWTTKPSLMGYLPELPPTKKAYQRQNHYMVVLL